MPDPEAERARLLSAGRRMQAQTDQEALIMHNIAAFCLSVLAAAALLASVASAQDVGFDGFPFPIPAHPRGRLGSRPRPGSACGRS